MNEKVLNTLEYTNVIRLLEERRGQLRVKSFAGSLNP